MRGLAARCTENLDLGSSAAGQLVEESSGLEGIIAKGLLVVGGIPKAMAAEVPIRNPSRPFWVAIGVPAGD